MATGPSRRKSSVRYLFVESHRACRVVNNSPSLSPIGLGGRGVLCVLCALVLSLSLSLSFGRLSSFLVFFDRALKTRGTRGRWRRERERERERSLVVVVVVILVALLALLNAISMARKLGTKKCRTQQQQRAFYETPERTTTFAFFRRSQNFRFESKRTEERERETKEGLALARSFVRVTQRVCDILKNILLDGRLTRQKMEPILAFFFFSRNYDRHGDAISRPKPDGSRASRHDQRSRCGW
jgi:hypothetical protein